MGRERAWGFFAVLTAMVFLFSAGPVRAQGADGGEGSGTFGGRLFTADHPESLAAGAEVFLIFQNAKGEARQLVTRAGSAGDYRFSGLSTDPSIQYVLRVDYRGENFLGSPSQFASGETTLEQSFLVTTTAPPVGSGMGGAPNANEQSMPAGHPPVPNQTGRPVPVNLVHTLLITGALVVIFGLPPYLLRRREERRAESKSSGPIEALIRDIAALDLRHESGVLEREDYERVRQSLFRRLLELSSADRRESA